MENTIKVILVGRHTDNQPTMTWHGKDVEILEQRSILWAQNHEECRRQWFALGEEAKSKKAAILLQNVPVILAGVVSEVASRGGQGASMATMVGGIVSIMGDRKANEVREFECALETTDATIEAIRFANARAKVEIVPDTVSWHHDSRGEVFSWQKIRVTVDPVPEFIFSHIADL